MKSGRSCRIATLFCWSIALSNWKPERIVGIKNVTANEPFFTGHFPDFPVMPGVLIVEAMAQTAGVLVLKQIPDRDKNWCCWWPSMVRGSAGRWCRAISCGWR